MTQTFRSRDEQLASYPETVCVGLYPGKSWKLELDADDLDPDFLVEGPVLYVRCDIAHQKQKEAEERQKNEPIAWLFEARVSEDGPWIKCASAYEPIVVHGLRRNIRRLYALPANVAGLEAKYERCLSVLGRCVESMNVVMDKMGEWVGENGPPEYLRPEEVINAMEALVEGRRLIRGSDAP